MDPKFLEALPEDLRANEVISGFETPEALVRAHLDASEKLKTPAGFDALPEELKKDPNVSRYKTVEELAKGHIEAVKLVGKKGVVIPAADAPQEEKDKFLNAIGRPEKADGYKFTPLKDVHPELKITPEVEGGFKAIAHKAGLTQQQADFLFGWFNQSASQGMLQKDKTTVEAREASATKLRTEWGAEYNNNLALANRLVTKFGGKDAVDAFGPLADNPAVLKVLASIGRKMSEDAVNHNEVNDLATSATDAKARIKEINIRIMNTKEGTPEYNELISQRTRLYQVAYPEGGAE